MIPEEVSKEHMAICKKCKEREAVRRMADFHVDWLDCFWDCPNDYEHWAAEQREYDMLYEPSYNPDDGSM